MSRKLVIACALALLATSLSAAAWSGKGAYEPSTPYDESGRFMFTDADTSPSGSRIYFNGFMTDGEVVVTSTSPNVGLLETAIQPRGAQPLAMLGVWKDCNKDGYIGNTDAMWQYASQLLLETDICPPSNNEYPTHNDGFTVYEFLPLRWNNGTTTTCCDRNGLVDNYAKVWADAGLPDAETSITCDPLAPPPNTYSSTGGMLAYLDCQAEYRGTNLINSAATATGLSTLSFEDVPEGHQAESGSILNVPFPLGASEDESYVTAFDCSNGAEHVEVEHPNGKEQLVIYTPALILNFTDSDGILFQTDYNPNVGVPSVNTGGSFWGTLNETDASSSNCDPDAGTMGDNDDCWVFCEQGRYVEFGGRVRPDALLVSANWPGSYPQDPANAALERDEAGSSFRTFWYGFDNVDTTGPITRGGEPAPAYHWTYYAYVSDLATGQYELSLPPGPTGIYGSEACAASAEDGKTRFDCNADNWWLDEDGNQMTPRQAGSGMCWDAETDCDPRVFVGQGYNLRDIDCYDYATGAQRNSGLTAPALLTGQGC